jgi:hypothetical protein
MKPALPTLPECARLPRKDIVIDSFEDFLTWIETAIGRSDNPFQASRHGTLGCDAKYI